MSCPRCGAPMTIYVDKNWAKCQSCPVEMPYYKKDSEQANDPVDHPSHYTDGGIETIDFIEAKRLNYHTGTAVKYISRAGKKDPNTYIQDLKKAIWFLQREVDRNGK